MEISFKIPYPKNKSFSKDFSFNSIYSGKHWVLRKRDSDYWHKLVKYYLLKQKVPLEVFTNPVRLEYYFNDRLDLSNHSYITKMIEDGLKGYLLKDDSRKYVKEIFYGWFNEDYILVKVMEIIADE